MIVAAVLGDCTLIKCSIRVFWQLVIVYMAFLNRSKLPGQEETLREAGWGKDLAAFQKGRDLVLETDIRSLCSK